MTIIARVFTVRAALHIPIESTAHETNIDMESTRQRKISKQIQKDLGHIFQNEARSLFGEAFITVTQVMVSPDLGLAKVYVSFLLVKDKEALLELIEEHKNILRQHFGNKMKHQVRKIPDLRFYFDNTQDVMDEVNDLFKDLDIPSEDEGKYNDDEYKE